MGAATIFRIYGALIGAVLTHPWHVAELLSIAGNDGPVTDELDHA
jgi:hypothetical protein